MSSQAEKRWFNRSKWELGQGHAYQPWQKGLGGYLNSLLQAPRSETGKSAERRSLRGALLVHCLALGNPGLASITPSRIEKISHLLDISRGQIVYTLYFILVNIHSSLNSMVFTLWIRIII